MTEMSCDGTQRVLVGEPECTGWREAGFPWHGCNLPPNHQDNARTRRCQCKCGMTWLTYRRNNT